MQKSRNKSHIDCLIHIMLYHRCYCYTDETNRMTRLSTGTKQIHYCNISRCNLASNLACYTPGHKQARMIRLRMTDNFRSTFFHNYLVPTPIQLCKKYKLQIRCMHMYNKYKIILSLPAH